MNEYIKVNPIGGSGGSGIPVSEKGAPNGVAELDGSGLVTLAELPPVVVPDHSIVYNSITLGSLATGSITVVDYTNLTGTSFDIIDARALSDITLTEGVDWTAATSNDATALSIKNAINLISDVYIQISATVLANVITITAVIPGEDQNCTFTNLPDPYLTAVNMVGGVGDFDIPGILNANYTNLTVRGSLTTTLGNVTISKGKVVIPVGSNTVPSLTFAASGTGLSGGGGIIFICSNTELGDIAPTNSATDTSLILYDRDTASLQRVTVGAGDSGGSGYKVLRIPN